MKNILNKIISQNESLIEDNQYFLPSIVGIFVFMHAIISYFFIFQLAFYIPIIKDLSIFDNIQIYDFILQIITLIFFYYLLDSFFYRIKNPKFQLNSSKMIVTSYISGIIAGLFAILMFSIIYAIPLNFLDRDLIFVITKPIEEVLVVIIVKNKYISN